MAYSNSWKSFVTAAHSEIELTSRVASQNEVASFTCHACGDSWLSRIPTVVEQGCSRCALAEEDLEAEMRQALFRVNYG